VPNQLPQGDCAVGDVVLGVLWFLLGGPTSLNVGCVCVGLWGATADYVFVGRNPSRTSAAFAYGSIVLDLYLRGAGYEGNFFAGPNFWRTWQNAVT